MVQQVFPGGVQGSGQPAVTQPRPPVIIDDTVEPPIVIEPPTGDEVHVGGVVSEFLAKAVERLPEDFYQIERATWYTRAISPLRSRDLELGETRYELNTGAVDGYLMDKDGLRYLRKWRVPASSFTPYEFDDSSDDGFGILRDLSGIVDGLIPSGPDYGDIVSVDGVEVFKDFGILGPIFSDTRAVRIEYRRRGELVCEHEGFGPDFTTPEVPGGTPPTSATIVGAWFEAVLDNEDSEETNYLDLKDTDGNLYATISIDAGVEQKRIRESILTLRPDATLYPSMRMTVDNVNFSVRERRVILDVEYANMFKAQIFIEMGEMLTGAHSDFDLDLTAFARRIVVADYEDGNCVFHWPMGTGDFGEGGGEVNNAIENYQSFFDYVRDVAYGSPAGDTGGNTGNNSKTTVFKYDPTKYATLSTIELEVCAACADEYDVDDGPVNTGAITSFAALYNKTTGLLVAGSEIEFDNPYPEVKSVAIALDATNLTAGDEYWVQYKIVTGLVVDDIVTNGMTLYNSTLKLKTASTSMAQVPMKVGNSLGGGGSSGIFDTSVRWLFEEDMFSTGATYTFETSARLREGVGATATLLVAADADTGFPLVTKNAGTATATTGAWVDTSSALGGQLQSSYVELSIALATAIMEFGSYGFLDSDFPTGAAINSMVLDLSQGVVGQSARWTVRSRISGVNQTAHNGALHEDTSLVNSTPPPNFFVINTTEEYELINDLVWTIADLDDAVLKIRAQANQPNNATLTTFYLGGTFNAAILKVGYGTDLTDSDLALGDASQERVVSDPIIPEDQVRYFLHFTSDNDNNVNHGVGLVVAEIAVA